MTILSGVISPPVPLYQNVPIQAGYYQPSRFVISDVTRGDTTIVTTVLDMNYVIGQEVRLLIPPSFGCIQLNEVSGFVLSLPQTNQVEIDINSIGVDAYIASTSPIQSAQIIAIGDINTGAINTHGRIDQETDVPGSFINISPL